jgi:hypothetical protein
LAITASETVLVSEGSGRSDGINSSSCSISSSTILACGATLDLLGAVVLSLLWRSDGCIVIAGSTMSTLWASGIKVFL